MSRVIGQGSTALITGCSSGLGLALVRFLLQRGLRVWGFSRRRPPLEEGNFCWVACDLSDSAVLEPALKTVVGESGGIDLVVNNAGFGQIGSLKERSAEEMETAMRVVLLAPMLTTRFFLNEPKPPAVIVNTSSLARELPIPLMSTYNSGKAGLSGFTLGMTLDRDTYPEIRFIDFCPGDYNTPFVDSCVMSAPSRDGGDIPGSSNGGAGHSAFQKRFVRHHAVAPGPERAAADLWRAIERGREGTVRSGTFFQAVIAPIGVRLLPAAWLRGAIRRYYGM